MYLVTHSSTTWSARVMGPPMNIDLEPWYSSNFPYEIMQYCWVEIIQNPSRVRLHTYN